MLAKRIIPCLGVANGRVQNGVQFRDMVDAGDPVECAERYEIQGALRPQQRVVKLSQIWFLNPLIRYLCHLLLVVALPLLRI